MSAIMLASAFMLITKMALLLLGLLTLGWAASLVLNDKQVKSFRGYAEKIVMGLFGVFRCQCKKGRVRAKYCFMGISIRSRFAMWYVFCLGFTVLTFHIGATVFLVGAGYAAITAVSPAISYFVYSLLSYFLR